MAQATNLSTTSRFHNLSHEQLADAIDDHSDQVRRAPRERRVIPPTKRTDVSAVCLGSRREGRLRPPLNPTVCSENTHCLNSWYRGERVGYVKTEPAAGRANH
jgi:hypothetical protein